MRVCIVAKKFPLVSETFVVRQARALDATVVAQRIYDSPIDDIRTLEIGLRDERFPISSLFRKAGRRIRRHRRIGGVEKWDRTVERRWAEFLSTEKPTVVLAQFGPVGIMSLPSCRKLNIPLVLHLHGYDASGLLSNPSYRRALAAVLEYASAVIVVADYMREAAVQLGCSEDKIFIIPCGVPLDSLRIAENVATQPCRFISVGRLVPKKAPLTTLRAFEICAHKVADARLTVIGDGPLYQDVQKWLRKREIAPRVSLLGELPFRLVNRYLSSSSVFVQHSVTAANGDKEGWPVAIAEASAVGLPVVATRHAGIVEQVIDEESGYLVEEGDVERMAERMIDLAQDPSKRATLGLAGQRHIRSIGDAAKQIERLRNVLLESSK